MLAWRYLLPTCTHMRNLQRLEPPCYCSASLFWRGQVECDGQRLELAPDIEGLLVINIPSYMGGVNLWASSAASPSRRRFAPQSFCDGLLEVGNAQPWYSVECLG